MKPINAYQNLLDFFASLEVIKKSLMTIKEVDRLKAVQNFFDSMNASKLPDTLKSLSEYFGKKLTEEKEQEIKAMLEVWHGLLLREAESANKMLSFSEIPKEFLDMKLSGFIDSVSNSHKDMAQRGIEQTIKGVEIFMKSFNNLKTVIVIMDDFVIPNMSKEDLKPEIDINFSPN